MCLKYRQRDVITYKVGGRVRCFVVRRDNFWRVYSYIREHHKGGIAWKMLCQPMLQALEEPLPGQPRRHPKILCPACMIDHETAMVIGMANRWKHSHTPPWQVFRDGDRGAIEAACAQVWNAQATITKEEHDQVKHKIKEQERHARSGGKRGRH